jgi:glyoxylase I family protein
MSKTPFTIQRLDHLVLRTDEPHRLIEFYQNLGCEIVRDASKDLGLVQLRLGDSMLDIVDTNGRVGKMGDAGAAPSVHGRNLDHFAVRVEPFDKEAILAFCEEHGIEANSPPTPLLGADGYGPAVYIRDPMGNRMELKGPPVQSQG